MKGRSASEIVANARGKLDGQIEIIEAIASNRINPISFRKSRAFYEMLIEVALACEVSWMWMTCGPSDYPFGLMEEIELRIVVSFFQLGIDCDIYFGRGARKLRLSRVERLALSLLLQNNFNSSWGIFCEWETFNDIVVFVLKVLMENGRVRTQARQNWFAEFQREVEREIRASRQNAP